MKLKPVNLLPSQDADRNRELFNFRISLIQAELDSVFLAGRKQGRERFEKSEPVDLEGQILRAQRILSREYTKKSRERTSQCGPGTGAGNPRVVASGLRWNCGKVALVEFAQLSDKMPKTFRGILTVHMTAGKCHIIISFEKVTFERLIAV